MTSTSVVYDIIARDKASRSLRSVADSATKSESRMSKLATAAKRGALAVGTTAVVAAGVFVKNAVSLEAQFGKTMNLIQANTGATGKQMKGLSALAIKMGRDTVFSASDAADAMLELAKGGLSPATIQAGALRSAMNLAAAGQLDMATAANTTVKAMGAFGLKGKQTKQIANALAGAANASAADVSDLTQALAQSGLSAHNAGLTIQETTAILAAFSNAGINGSDAGTSLKTMFARLQPSTKSAALAMESVGLYTKKTGSAFVNQNGTFKSAAQIAGILHEHLKGLSQAQRSQALTTIFGSDAQRAATVLYNEGAKGIRKYEKATKDSRAAQKMARAGMKGTAGAIEQLKGSLETVELQFGMMAKPLVQGAIHVATKAINGVGNALDKVSGKLKPLERNISDFFGGLAGHAAKTKTVKAGPLFAGGPQRMVQQMLPPSSARQLGTKIRDTISGALSGGLKGVRWNQLGNTIGNGLAKALSGLGKLATTLTAKFGALMAKIDWVGIGISIGKQAPAMLAGLVAGLLNFDLMGLLKGLASHWQDVLLAIIAIAFTPGKIVGKVAEVLARIPLVGRLLAWGLKAFKGFADKIGGWVLSALKGMGKAFLDGFRSIFPDIGKGFSQGLSLLPTKLGVVALDLVAKGKAMLVKLGEALIRWQTAPIRALGKLVGRILKFFAPAGRWLLGAGKALLRGFGNAIRGAWNLVTAPVRAGWRLVSRLFSSGVSAVVGLAKKMMGLLGRTLAVVGRVLSAPFRAAWNAVKGVVSAGVSKVVGATKALLGKIKSALGNLGGLLKNEGVNIVEGLISGIGSMAGRLASFVASFIKNHIPGPVRKILGIASPSKVMRKIGEQTGQGLHDGLKKSLEKTEAMLKGKVNRLVNTVQNLRQNAADMASTVSQNFMGDLYAGGTLAAFNAQLQQDQANAEAFSKALKTIATAGASKKLYSEIATSGNLAVAQQLAALGRPGVLAENKLYASRNAAVAAVGQQASSHVYGDRISDVTHELQGIRKDLKRVLDRERTIHVHDKSGDPKKTAREVARHERHAGAGG